MAAAAVVAYAGKAGRHDLRHQRDALGNVLVLAENEDQERHQNAARGDAQKSGEQPSGDAGDEPADDLGKVHPRSLRLPGAAAVCPASLASSHSASISSSVAPSSERPLAASARSI